MTKSSPTEADVLRCGYEAEHFTKSQIAAWADQQIMACDIPSNALIDLSLCRKADPRAVASNLRSLGSDDSALCVKLQFAFLGLAFRDKRISLEYAVRTLYLIAHDLANEHGVDDDQRNIIYHLDDGYYLAFSGIYGSVAEIEREFANFIQPYVLQLYHQFPQLVTSGE